MAKNDGVWRREKTPEMKKLLSERVTDALIGPREGKCGVTGYAGRADGRYRCQNCGNYHLTGGPQ